MQKIPLYKELEKHLWGQKKNTDLELSKFEQIFRDGEQEYHNLYENAPIGYFSVDPDDGSILRANNEALRLTGTKKQDLKRMKVFDLYADTTHGVPKAKAVFERFQAGESIWDEELQMKRKDGKTFWVNLYVKPVKDASGKIVESQSMVIDISKRKEMEIELEARAANLEKLNTTLKDLLKEREQNHAELLKQKSEMEKVNKELMETNRAIGILARNIDRNRQEMESTVAKAINTKLMPLIENLRKAKTLESIRVDLDILAASIQSIIADFTTGQNLMTSLTPTELRIATMIKAGLKSQEIADKLCVSLHTTKTHRRNIRKKLNISNSRINLASYLYSIM